MKISTKEAPLCRNPKEGHSGKKRPGFGVQRPKNLEKTRFESQRYLRERDHEAGRIACRRRTDHGRNDGGSDRLWLFLSYTYFSPRPSSGGNLFDLRPRRIAFGSPSSARPPPCSCGGAPWAGYLATPTFVAAITGHLSSGACG